MPRLGLNLYAGLGDRIVRYSTIQATTGQGLEYIILPIVIAALIVFNTMLGSVYERVREIGIFSAVGFGAQPCGDALFRGVAGVRGAGFGGGLFRGAAGRQKSSC
jgi:hypothetical protein